MSCSGRAKADQAKGSASKDFRSVVDRTWCQCAVGETPNGRLVKRLHCAAFPYGRRAQEETPDPRQTSRAISPFPRLQVGCDCHLNLVTV